MNLGHGRGPGSSGGTSSGRKHGDVVPDQFPAGLRVLIVDDDPTCLMILERMLRNCLYEVTKCNRAEIALSLLRKNKNGFDIIISDVHMPDMDGFKLLEHVGLEMELPVIMMSADESKDVVLKGVTHGAVDYLIKPVRIEALKNIWQHVVRKRRSEWSIPAHSGSLEDTGEKQQQQQQQKGGAGEDTDNNSSSVNEGNWRNPRKRKDEDGDEQGEDKDESSSLKKPRVVWSVELHQQFVAAVNQLGVDKAVPKKILELMNVDGLTRENVASHLQKYRIYLRRLGSVSQHQGNSFMSGQDPNYAPLSALNGFDLQALAVAGQLPAQSLAQLQVAGLARPCVSKQPSSLVDHRNIFSFENAKMRYGEGQSGGQPQALMMMNGGGGGSKQQHVNLLHGVPTAMEPKQLAGLQSMGSRVSVQHQMAAMRAAQNVQSSTVVRPAGGPQPPRGPPMLSSSSSHGQPMLPNTVSGRNSIPEIPSRSLPSGYNAMTQLPTTSAFNTFPPELPGNSFPLATNPGISVPVPRPASYQEEVNSSNAKRTSNAGFNPGYDIFGELQHSKGNDWDLRNIGMAFDAHQDAPSTAFSVSEGYSSCLTQRNGKNTNASATVSEGGVVFLPGEAGSHGRDVQGYHHNHHLNQIQMYGDGGSVRVKSERPPQLSEAACPPPATTLFHDQYNNQEDLMSALLKQEGIAAMENEFDFDNYSIDNISV